MEQLTHDSLTTFPASSPDPDATFSSPITPGTQLSSIIASRLPSPFLCLSLLVLKIQRGRRTRIAPPPSPVRFPSSAFLPGPGVLGATAPGVAAAAAAADDATAAGGPVGGGSAMGRGSRACSVLGSALLLLLLSLCSAAAQKGSTWKTLSGKLDSRRLTSFLARFRGAMRVCDLI